MRKLTSLLLTACLLLVVCLPNMSLHALCGMSKTSVMEGHSTTMANIDANTCRIECACGCHASIDGLPHLLSPHINAAVASLNNTGFSLIEYYYSAVFHAYFPDVVVPPPIVS